MSLKRRSVAISQSYLRMPSFSDQQIRDTLRQHWGYNDFRPVQLEIIRSVLAGNNTIGLLPTGGGKSITFQVPTMMTDGMALVVTPLISLMKDQVDNLRRVGIKGVYLHSGLSRHESTIALDRCRYGKAKFLYVSPEKLLSERFRAELRELDIRLIVVDEAHCISQWGYDFRPAYLRIADVRQYFPDAPVLALTASATPEVIDDIADKLSINTPSIFRLSFSRENISYVVRRTDFKELKLIEILRKVSGTAIVYVRSRARTRELAELLCNEGISADYYHAGLHTKEKEDKQNLWKDGTTRVIVATNAFGMGIDKADVRLVVHFDLPSSLEEYYQEAGRAGRDGLPSFAVVLANNRDKATLSRRLSEAFPPRETIKRIYELLGNYFDLPVGEGFNRLFDFNIDVFCTTFKFMPSTVVAALKILTQAGYIEFTEEMSIRSRVMMEMNRHELYSLQLSQECERVLQMILRTVTGIFADYKFISEYELARNLDYTEETVYQALLTLARMHVLHYVPHQCSPYVLYTTSRELPSEIKIPLSVYEERLEKMRSRIEAMQNFVFNDNGCRVNAMLRYFGEEPAEPCGKCDICREKNLRKPSRNEKRSLRESILYLASQPGGHDVAYIIEQINAPRDQIITAIRNLADDGAVNLTKTHVTASK